LGAELRSNATADQTLSGLRQISRVIQFIFALKNATDY
jgi:hypothetical protein